MSKRKTTVIEKLKVEIEIRDRLIGFMLKEFVNHKIELPEEITVPLGILFEGKIKVVKGEKDE